MAMKQRFLMHSLFSVAALHIVWSKPEDQSSYIDRAIHHHNIALRQYTSALNDIAPENGAAVFVCSSLIVVFSLHLAAVRPHESMGPVEEILGIFILLRGIRTVATEVWEWVLGSGIAIMSTARQNALDSLKNLPRDVRDALRLLEDRNQASAKSEDDKKIYAEALEESKNSF